MIKLYIPPEKVKYIQAVVPIEDIIYATGYKLIGTGSSRGINECPVCKRDHTHIKINSKKNLFNCFSPQCGFRGNQFHWIMEVEKKSFPEAVIRVAEIGGIRLDITDEEKTAEQKRQKALQLTLDFYKNHRHKSEYLTKRGINEKTQDIFQVGYAPGGALLKKYLNENGFSNEFLLEIGLVRHVNNKLMDRFFNSVIIPDIRDGRIYDLYGRHVDPDTKNGHIYLYGHKSLIGWHLIKPNDEVYICEAPIDAMSCFQLFEKPAISIGGAGKFDNWHLYQIKKNGLKPILALDSDEAGIYGTMNIIELLSSNGIDSKVLIINPYKDINQILTDHKTTYQPVYNTSQHFVYEKQLDNMPIDFIKQYLETRLGKNYL